MLDISALLEEIKASPYRDIIVAAPHSGRVSFADIKVGDKLDGPQGQWKEKPGARIATIERERNPKDIFAPEKGMVSSVRTELEGKFVEAGEPLAILRHLLTKAEVERLILKKTLYLFRAPERAKYYFTPEIDKKIRASAPQSVKVREGMDLMIMSRMKREAPLRYSGPEGVIYAIYFTYNENMDAGAPLLGVCPENLLAAIQEVVMRVNTEWKYAN